MLSALLLASFLTQGNVRTVDLVRGTTIQPSDPNLPSYSYWAESDTFLDAVAGNQNFAGEPVIDGGPSKTILIRFGDLNRAAGGARHVRKATLVLTIAAGDKPNLKSIQKVLVPWNAGPYFTINALINRNAHPTSDEKKPGVEEIPSAPAWTATWRHRFTGDGGASWQQAGANGPEDATPIADAQVTATEKTFAIDNLTAAVQKMIDQPSDNNGFALHFQNECEFFSCRAAVGKPVLHLEFDAPAPTSGPDLSVTYIEKTDGQETSFQGHIKNVGTDKATPFSAVWTINGKTGVPFDVSESLAPGAETIVTTHASLRPNKIDHRVQTVQLRIVPKGPDASSANDSLVTYPDGRQIDVVIPAGLTASQNLVGSKSIEDWVQEQVRIFNEVYAAESRFSFAPDATKERFSVRKILSAATGGSAATVPADESAWLGSDPVFLKSVALAAGLPNYGTMNFPNGERIDLKDAGKPIKRGSVDLYPGVAGYGDTRYEGSLPGAVTLQYGPYPTSEGLMPLVPSGLMSATDVAYLNNRIDHPDTPLPLPKTLLLKASDMSGRPLNNLQLDFFQSAGGRIPDGPAAFTVSTGTNAGTALLPSKNGAGPFGKLDPDGGNGTFLIKATANGMTEWGWLKAWQAIDTASRGNLLAGVLEVRFNLPSAVLDTDTNLARDRIISDSTNQLPAHLAPLLGDIPTTEVTLGAKSGDWLEVDLGRDRTIGEISLIADPGAFWQQFDIMVYITGQKPDEATAWTKEMSWDWTSINRSGPVPGDAKAVSVGYCAPATRIRFIRIVNRSGKVGKLKGIRVTPVKVAP